MLYLPAGRQNAYIINDWTADLYRRRRKLAFILGTCNLCLVLLSLIIFYGNPDRVGSNITLHLLLAIGWIAVPFLSLYGYLVFPITRLLGLFPAALSSGQGPQHLARRFSIGLGGGDDGSATKQPQSRNA
jgi:hypothetical protein